jgi:hypothetical protein
MKRWLIVFAVLLFVLPIFSEGRQDDYSDLPDEYRSLTADMKALRKGEVIEIENFFIEALLPDNFPAEAQLAVRMIEMKEEYKNREPIVVSDLKGTLLLGVERISNGGQLVHRSVASERGGISLFPLNNLDIFILQNGKKHPIEDYGVQVRVSIPFSFLETANRGTEPSYQLIFVFDPAMGKGTWLPLTHPRSGITSFTRNPDSLEFVISQWPIDDKMICSGP